MANKDINLHIKTEGGPETQREFEKVSKEAKGIGDGLEQSGRKGTQATKNLETRVGVLGKSISGVAKAAAGMVSAFLGLEGVRRVVDWLISRLERIQQLQQKIYEQSLTMQQVGQALEFQTGTVGQQQQWAQRAMSIQQAGGLQSIGQAQQMMIAADIAFSGQGGVQSKQTMDLLRQVAPFFGAAQLSGEEISSVFDFASTAGVDPNAEGWQQYLAQLQAGYTSSKATNFGQFMSGLQKGGTAYVAAGGTLQGAISQYAGARSVTASDQLASTLLERVARLSAGGYERPRQAIEQALGVRWQDLSMDQRTQALIDYAASLPDSQRVQILVEQGFPAEIATEVGKLITPGARQSLAKARQVVGSATPQTMTQQAQAYMQTDVAKQNITQAGIEAARSGMGSQFGPWRRAEQAAQEYTNMMIAAGKDRFFVKDDSEPYVNMISYMRETLARKDAQDMTDQEYALYHALSTDAQTSSFEPFAAKRYQRTAQKRYQEYLDLGNAPITINDYSTRYEVPRGSQGPGQPRVSPEDVQ